MNRFTIDADFLSYAGLEDNMDLFLDVLMIFTQDNEFRICLDSLDIAFKRYIDISMNSESIRFWFRCLFENKQNRKYIDYITIRSQNYLNEKQVYIEICNRSCSIRKKIIVNNKQDYYEFMRELSYCGIELLDGYEAKKILNTRIVQISTGSNSPNIIGNGNVTNK